MNIIINLTFIRTEPEIETAETVLRPWSFSWYCWKHVRTHHLFSHAHSHIKAVSRTLQLLTTGPVLFTVFSCTSVLFFESHENETKTVSSLSCKRTTCKCRIVSSLSDSYIFTFQAHSHLSIENIKTKYRQREKQLGPTKASKRSQTASTFST